MLVSMVMDNLNDLGEVCSIIFLEARSDCRDFYTFHRKIYGVKISHSYNFNPVSITLWYENNIIIFSLSIVMDSDKWGTMSVTIAIFSDSLLGNISNDTTGVCSSKYIIFCWICSNLCYFVHGCVQMKTEWHDDEQGDTMMDCIPTCCYFIGVLLNAVMWWTMKITRRMIIEDRGW